MIKNYVIVKNFVMLDERTESVLCAINSSCQEGAFTIIEKNDILSAVPAKFKLDDDNLTQCINELVRDDFIELKYQDNSSFCVSPLPKGRHYCERKLEEKKSTKSKKRISFYNYLLIFLLMFIASFLAMLLYFLIF